LECGKKTEHILLILPLYTGAHFRGFGQKSLHKLLAYLRT